MRSRRIREALVLLGLLALVGWLLLLIVVFGAAHVGVWAQ
jgi:hypothetical protein